MGLEEALDQFQSATVVPMELLTPMVRFFMEKWLDLPNSRLAKVDDVHRSGFTKSPVAKAIIADSCQSLPNREQKADIYRAQGPEMGGNG